MEFLIIILIMVGLMFFMTRGQRKKQKEAQEFRDSVQIGDEVMTQSGMLGVVVETDEKVVTIESTEENYTRWVRAAIGPVPPTMAPAPEDEEFESEDDAVITSDDSTITAEDLDNDQN